MPTYDYACKKCGHRFEAFQSMNDDQLTTCPQCTTESLQRLIGAGAGLVFKGSGFYLTDYKKSSSTPAAASATNANGSGSAASDGGDPGSTSTNTSTNTSTSPDTSSGTSSPNTTPKATGTTNS
jgi:putative FmdB family regulatory protein